MIISAQHLIDAHSGAGFMFDPENSNDNRICFTRAWDDAVCWHGTITVEGQQCCESVFVVEDDQENLKDEELVIALQAYFDQLAEGDHDEEQPT